MELHEPGTLIDGRYQVLELIGSGGFGAVYKAIDTGFKDRLVAVKQMLEGVEGTNETYLQGRYEQECELLERLQHPNIPRIYQHFKTPNSLYLVMDFVDGTTLEHWVDNLGSPAPVQAVLRYSLQVCQVLEYLHGQPVPLIHRDIKPANMILRPDGSVVLVDFGLARTLDVENTRTQVGTVGYAPLEQVRGASEPCSDIYALGASMYHLLTGQKPKPFQIPNVNESRPDVPERVSNLVLMATQQNPARCFMTASRMRQAIEEALAQVTGQAHAPEDDFYPEIHAVKDGNLPSSPVPIMLGALAVLIGIIVVMGQFSGFLANISPHRAVKSTGLPSGDPSPLAPALEAPEVPHLVDVSAGPIPAEVKAQLDQVLSAASAPWAWVAASHVDNTGALSAAPSETAALILAPATLDTLPRCVSFRLLPHFNSLHIVISSAGAMAALHFDGHAWTAGLSSEGTAPVAGRLTLPDAEGIWSDRIGLEVAGDGAELHLEGAGTPLHLSGQFDSHNAINIVLYPEDGYRRVEIKDVAVSHTPLDF